MVTFALPLERMAYAFARFEQLEAGERVAAAMREYPELIRGRRAADTRLMRACRAGWRKAAPRAYFVRQVTESALP